MKLTIIQTLSISAISVAFSNAQAAVLTFEGLGNFESVNQFYNGGTGGNGSGPGTDLGVSFSSNSLAIIDSDAPSGGGISVVNHLLQQYCFLPREQQL